MKQITLSEARDIISAIDNSEYVEDWRKFVHAYYGTKAHRVVIHTSAEYNDEGYSAHMQSFDVYDIKGQKLSIDENLTESKKNIKKSKQRWQEEVDRNKQSIRNKYPKLDDAAIESMAISDVGEFNAEKSIYSDMMDWIYDIGFPGQGDVGQDYTKDISLIIAEDTRVPKFFVEYDE